MSRVLDERFSLASFEAVVDGWLMPSLVALGQAWADGRVSVAGEHLVAYAIQRRLAAAFDAASAHATGPRVIVGLPPGVRHELGQLAFAAAACRAGLNATYVGADLPAEDWVTATQVHDAVCVVLAAHCEDDLPGLRNVVDSLRPPGPSSVGVGGAQQDASPQSASGSVTPSVTRPRGWLAAQRLSIPARDGPSRAGCSFTMGCRRGCTSHGVPTVGSDGSPTYRGEPAAVASGSGTCEAGRS